MPWSIHLEGVNLLPPLFWFDSPRSIRYSRFFKFYTSLVQRRQRPDTKKRKIGVKRWLAHFVKYGFAGMYYDLPLKLRSCLYSCQEESGKSRCKIVHAFPVVDVQWWTFGRQLWLQSAVRQLNRYWFIQNVLLNNWSLCLRIGNLSIVQFGGTICSPIHLQQNYFPSTVLSLENCKLLISPN